MADAKETPQLLHLVIGGELRHLHEPVFRDLSQVEFVGAYGSYDEAKKAWKARSSYSRIRTPKPPAVADRLSAFKQSASWG